MCLLSVPRAAFRTAENTDNLMQPLKGTIAQTVICARSHIYQRQISIAIHPVQLIQRNRNNLLLARHTQCVTDNNGVFVRVALHQRQFHLGGCIHIIHLSD